MADSIFDKMKKSYSTLVDALDTPEAKAEKAKQLEDEKKKKDTATPRWWMFGLDK